MSYDGTPPVGLPPDTPAAKSGYEETANESGRAGSASDAASATASSSANLTYINASNGFLTDGAWMLQFGLARIDGSGYPSVVTMRGHDDILCKSQAWHVFSFDGKDSWSHSESSVNYGYGGYNVGLAEGNEWLFGGGAHHTAGVGNFHVTSSGGGDMSNGLTTPEPMYWGYAPAFADFDSDGVVDVVANANPWSSSNTTSTTFVYKGPAGKWTLSQMIDKQYNVHHGIKFADFDRDGYQDMAVSNDILREPGHFIWRYNNEIGKFEPWVNDLDLAMRNSPFDVGDLDRDGLPDVVMVHSYKVGQDWKRDLEAYLQGPPGKFTASSSGLPTGAEISYLRLADADADGDLDIMATENVPKGQWYASELRIWLNDGKNSWTKSGVGIQGNILSTADWLEVDDIDNNGRADFVFPENWGDCSEGGGFRAYKESSPVSELKVWVDEPWGGERWFPGSIRHLKWRSAFPSGDSCGGSGTLEYSVAGPAGPWKAIDTMLACAGTYAWKVPADPSKNVFVRMTVKAKSGSASGLSGSGTLPFEIIGGSAVPLRASVSSPAGGEVWDVSSTQKLSWTVSGGQSPFAFDVEYSITGGSDPWKPIASGLTTTDHSWTIPDDPSTTASVRVVAKDSASPQHSAIAISNEFTIHRSPVPMQATLAAAPASVGPGGVSTLALELRSASGGVAGATVTLSSDRGGTISPVSESGGGSYTATFTAPSVGTSTLVTITANSSKVGYVDATASTTLTVVPELPDLKVGGAGIEVEGSAIEGDTTKFRARVLNSGLVDSGPFEVSLTIDGKALPPAPAAGLAAGAESELTWDWIAAKGKHDLKLTVDPKNAV
ncbi:MAG TPA: FG-GAP-like repeat-containing protein, partial [Thermoplasmata archaeon]|nr:FG-GAP-like repeat-containing protein [Thermoplasmata archaeon]